MIGGFSYLDAALLAIVVHVGDRGHVPRAHARGAVDPVLGGGGGAPASTSSSSIEAEAQQIADQFHAPAAGRPGRHRRHHLPGRLIIVHLITARISDTVLDSRVGAIDRILGLLFGVARGFVLVVIPFMFYESFVDKPEQQYPWVRDAMSRPYIKSTGDSLRIMLQRMVPPSLMGQPEQQQGYHSPRS